MPAQLIASRRHFEGADPIFAANAAAQRRAAEGLPVINAAMGALLDDAGKFVALESVMSQFPLLTMPEIAPYAPIAGDPKFLLALTQRYWPSVTTYGAGVATPGGTGALALSIRNLLEPGQRLLTVAPFWGPYATLAAENGVQLETVPHAAAGAALDLDAWRFKATEILAALGLIMLWLNDPCQNPTGRSLSTSDRRAMIAMLQELSSQGAITLLLDVAYPDYARDPHAVREALDDYRACGEDGRVLVGACLSMSKSHTLYGARAGALVFPWCDDQALASALATTCRGTFSNCARAPMSVLLRMQASAEATAALEEEHAYWRGMLASRADALDAALKSEGLPGAPWDGGFFVTLSVPDPQGLTARLAAEGVYVVPLADGIRIGICGLRVADAGRFAAAMRAALAG